MPDRDDWTAAMVLEWILSRDLSAVLSMDVYGATAYDGDQAVPVRPRGWQDVQSEHLRKDLRPGESGVRETVRRGLTVVLPAMTSVYAKARIGRIQGFARRNGTGDLEQIPPYQWAGLRFCSFDGRDLAIPVNIDQTPLPLPQPPEDYFAGLVPMEAMPAVWPDPLFRADQVMELWPPVTPNQISERASERTQTTRNEPIADRNQRWYDDFEKRRKTRSYRTYQVIYDAMSKDEFGGSGKFETIKRAVNSIRGLKGETSRR
jgi:hypothetical protein